MAVSQALWRSAVRLGLPLVLAVALAGPARAWHEPSRPVTEYSAATLHSGEWRVYPTTLLEVGLTDNLQIGALPLMYLGRLPNAFAKLRLFSGDAFSFAVSGGAMYFASSEAFDATVLFVPAAGHLSWRLQSGDLALHASLQVAYINANGTMSLKLGDLSLLDIDGTLTGTTVKVSPVLEWRRSRSFAWVVDGALSLSQSASGTGGVTTESNGGRTSVEVFATGSVEESGQLRGNVSLSAYWSWDVFHLRLGLGYGHADLPLLGAFIPIPTLVPELNFYWRF